MLTALTGAAGALPTDAVASWGHAGWGPGPWWFVFPLLWFLLFASVVFLLARRARRGGGPGGGRATGPGPVGLRGERDARGEVGGAGRRWRRAVLREGRPQP